MVVWINLLWLRVCAVVLGVRTIGCSESMVKAVGNSCALLRAMCNVIQVATWIRYMSGESYKGHGHRDYILRVC